MRNSSYTVAPNRAGVSSRFSFLPENRNRIEFREAIFIIKNVVLSVFNQCIRRYHNCSERGLCVRKPLQCKPYVSPVEASYVLIGLYSSKCFDILFVLCICSVVNCDVCW